MSCVTPLAVHAEGACELFEMNDMAHVTSSDIVIGPWL